MSERLSQAEIDALLNQSAPAQPQGLEEQVKVDIIGEVGNISMSQASRLPGCLKSNLVRS